MAVELIDPATGDRLERASGKTLRSKSRRYPVVGGVPRVCEDHGYTDNFGLQWNRFARTQLDRDGGRATSEDRFFRETGWSPEDLAGKDLLEVGSGAGRFSRVVLERTTANLWSVDSSSAVDANLANNGAIAPERFHLVQASVYAMPFPDDSFDKVFCLGVLQHTPDFEGAVRALIAKAKPGAEIVVDFYPIKGFWTKISAKYLLRPITRRMSHERLLGLIERNADWLIQASRLLDRAGLRHLNRFLPVVDIKGTLPPDLDERELREWVVLDTFDMFSPEYDNPQRVRMVADMFRRNGAHVTFAGYVTHNGNVSVAVVRGVKLGP